MRWRTEIAAPGTVLDDEDWQTCFEWSVGQWQWVREESGEEHDPDTGDWVLRGKQPMTVKAVVEQVPAVLHQWVFDSTQRAIRALEDLQHEDPAFDLTRQRLLRELADAGSSGD